MNYVSPRQVEPCLDLDSRADGPSERDRARLSSFFLRLPPELRDRIYQYALARKVVHIDALWDSSTATFALSHRACDCSDTALIDLTKRARVSPSEQSSTHAAGVLPCDGENCLASPDHLPMQLLRVNRQIYAEAALIPYAQNLFVFCDKPTNSLRVFTDRVSDIQRLAIRKAAMQKFEGWTLRSFLLRQELPGLRYLSLNILLREWLPLPNEAKSWIQERWEALQGDLVGVQGLEQLIGVAAWVSVEGYDTYGEVTKTWMAAEVERTLLCRTP